MIYCHRRQKIFDFILRGQEALKTGDRARVQNSLNAGERTPAQYSLNAGERADDLGLNGLVLIQHKDKYCFTSDAVALANAVNVKKGDVVADLGCGGGIIAVLLAGRSAAKKIYGIELQPDIADMARRSVARNKLENIIEIITAPMQTVSDVLGFESVDAAVCNPPYQRLGGGEISKNPSKAISRSEVAVTLNEVIDSAFGILKYGGRFYMINAAERLVDIFCLMRNKKIEPKTIRFVGGKSKTVIVEGVKGGKAGIKILN
jgi:tRNA1(Val) A37 N6-methylase TrmN6